MFPSFDISAGPPFRIRGNVFDPAIDGPMLEPVLDLANTNYILVQTARALTGEEVMTLEKAQCDPGRVMANFLYLCHYTPSDWTPIMNLPFVKWVGVYHPAFKIQPHNQYPTISQLPGVQRDSSTSAIPTIVRDVPLRISLHANADVSAATLVQRLVEEGIIDQSQTRIVRENILTVAHITKLRAIASHDSVYAVEEAQQPVLHDERSRVVVNSFLYDYPGPNSQIDNNTEYTGAGQVINIVDSGFNTGDPGDLPPGYTRHRLRNQYTPWNRINPNPYDFRDTRGHGTHVCGCALLNTWTRNMGGVDCTRPGLVRGPAPEADFVITKISNPAGIYWLGFVDLVDRPYVNDHARISNHSYGTDPPQKAYGAENDEIDQYIYDHDDLVVTYSAGNHALPLTSGPEITGEPASKNIITVGFTHNARKTSDAVAFDFTARREANHNDRHFMSSRGPTYEGRIKPDLVAPGSCVLSSASRSAQLNSLGGFSTDTELTWNSGSSFSSPCVAGCAAVVRQALERHGTTNPSAALVKALLINGAVGMSRSHAGPRIVPNNDEGFGRVNLGGTMLSIPPSAAGGYFDKPYALRNYDTSPPVYVNIPARRPLTSGGDAPGRTLKVTLVWTDFPGHTLVNIFGLAVEIPNIGRRHGNMGEVDHLARPWQFDAFNNVQQVEWRDVPTGLAEITVTCSATYKGRVAHYSLAWSLE